LPPSVDPLLRAPLKKLPLLPELWKSIREKHYSPIMLIVVGVRMTINIFVTTWALWWLNSTLKRKVCLTHPSNQSELSGNRQTITAKVFQITASERRCDELLLTIV
jgi:hypothetical protein